MRANRALLVIATVITPFLAITVSALMYPGFSLCRNAFSDLGHAIRSPSAPIFNLGLTITSFLLVIQATAYLWGRDRVLSATLLLASFFLQLIAVYDEVYDIRFDHLHYVVSAMFFVVITVFLILYAVRRRRMWAIVAATISVVAWATHFVMGIPPGAAVPELVSALLFLPAYVELMIND